MFREANPRLLEILKVGGKVELPDGSGLSTHAGEFGDRIVYWTWGSVLRLEEELSVAGLEEALRKMDHLRYLGDPTDE